MFDEHRDDLLYKPRLQEEREYRSEDVFKEDILIPTGDIQDPMGDIIEQYDEILPLVHGLPEGLSTPIEDLIKKLKLRMQIIRYENPPPGVVVYPPGDTNPYVPVDGKEPQWIHHHTEWDKTTEIPDPNPVNPPTSKVYDPVHGGTIDHYTHHKNPKREYDPVIHHGVEGSGGGGGGGTVIIDPWQPKGGGHLPPVIGKPEKPPTVIDPTVDIPKNYIIGTDVTEEPPGIEGLPAMFPEPTNKPITVKVPRSLVQIAQDSYKKDQVDLQSYYLQQLQYALRQYFQSMMMIMTEVGTGDINTLTREYHGDVVDIPDKNLQHLGDAIERSQVQRGQRTRYFRKVCSTSQTLQHMRQWHAAEKERERYYGEAYGDSRNYLDSESNSILRKSRAQYDQSYKASLYNMYRYLDASVEVTKDILNMTLQEAQAKGKLLKEGVDVFAQPEVVTEMHNESESQASDSTAIIQNNKGEGSGNGNVFDSGEDGNDAANTEGSAATSDTGYNASGTTQGQNEKTDEYNGASNESNDRWNWSNWGKKGSGTGADDSGIKSPNGYNYSKNDIQYLMDQGMTQDQAVQELSKSAKYQGPKKKFDQYNKGKGDDDSGIVAPNGSHYSKNDIDYLKSQGYSQQQAIDMLSKNEDYVVHDAKYQDKVKNEAAIKLGLREDPAKYSKYTAPNGQKISKNDIDYLKSKGYSEEQAVAELRNADKYKAKSSNGGKGHGGIFGGVIDQLEDADREAKAAAEKQSAEENAAAQAEVDRVMSEYNARQAQREAEMDARIDKQIADEEERNHQAAEAATRRDEADRAKARQEQQAYEEQQRKIDEKLERQRQQKAAEIKRQEEAYENSPEHKQRQADEAEMNSLLRQMDEVGRQYRTEEKQRVQSAWDAAHPDYPSSHIMSGKATPPMLTKEFKEQMKQAHIRGTQRAESQTAGLRARYQQLSNKYGW